MISNIQPECLRKYVLVFIKQVVSAYRNGNKFRARYIALYFLTAVYFCEKVGTCRTVNAVIPLGNTKLFRNERGKSHRFIGKTVTCGYRIAENEVISAFFRMSAERKAEAKEHYCR